MYGLDHLGIAKYGKLAAGEHPDGWALGAFTNVFGNALPAVELVLKTGRCPRVRLHLAWADDHKSFDLRAIEREAKRVGEFFKRFPLIDRRVSGGCEHTWDLKTASKVRSLVMRHMPSGVEYVNTPLLKGVKKGALLPDCINETHGSDARPLKGRFDFSFDGDNAVDSNITKLKRDLASAETFYIWNSQCNGRLTTEDKTPRPQRRAFPTSRYIDSWIALSGDSEGPLLPRGWLIKSHADQHQVPPEPRAGKPVCIFPVKAREVEFVADNGQVVAKALFGGSFSGGGFRYYCSDWGYLISEKAKRIQGHAKLRVRMDGKVYGTCHLTFRQGGFR